MNGHRRRGERLALTIYQLALLAFPRAFRRRYGADATEAFLDVYREAGERRGGWAAVGVLLGAVMRAIPAGLGERWQGRDRAGQGGPDRRRGRLETLGQDIRFALRSFRREPGFAGVAIGILALGIGASTTIFSVVDVVLLRGLPYPHADRLVYFDEGSHTGPDVTDWFEQLPAFEEIVAVDANSRDLTNEGSPTRIDVAQTTGNLFPVFGARAALGRTLAPGEELTTARVAVLSHRFWQARWGSDSTVVGRTLLLDGEAYEVVGVLAADFRPPSPLLRRQHDVDVWTPLYTSIPWLTLRTRYSLNVVGRLREGTRVEAARAQMTAWEEWAHREFPEQYTSTSGWQRRVPLVPLQEATVRSVSTALYLLLGAVGLMLLIACANVANLFLARGTDRAREMALRSALGAGRGRIIGQLLTESALLGLLGGLVGAGIATAGVRAFTIFSPQDIPRVQEIAVDYRILLFAFGLSVITGIVFGLAPAFYAARTDVNDALKEGTTKSSAGRGHMRLKNTLVVTELAIALVLLIGAGLLFRSFVGLTRVDTGFDMESVIVMPLTLGPGYEGESRRVQFIEQLTERIRALPGVSHVAAGATMPFSGGRCCWRSRIRTDPGLGNPDSLFAVLRPVTPEYFDVLGVPIVQGRAVRWSDPADGNTVTVITRELAERFFPGENPVGQRFTVGRNPVELTVVGVVNDLKHWSLSTDTDVDIYLPYAYLANDLDLATIGIRTTTDADVFAVRLRETVWALDSQMPVPEINKLPTLVSASIASERFMSLMLVTFSIIAAALAAGGIYGTMLYAVGQRHQEFGIRLALGATGPQLLRFVVRQGFVLTVIGIGIGMTGAYFASRVLESFVFGLTTTDPLTFAGVGILLTVVGCAACYVPARKAAGTDPMTTLRGE